MISRLEALKAMLASDPNNALARYGLAMDYVNHGDLESAMTEFATLMAAKPDYAAAYFHGGQTLEKLGRLDQARELYEKGIAVTGRTGDAHTRAELQGALDLLPV